MTIRDPQPASIVIGQIGKVLVVCTAASLVACSAVDSLLVVEAPGQVIADSLKSPRYANLLVQSAIADFECAAGGYIVAAGTLGDELSDAQTNYAGYWPVDRRDVGEEGGALVTQTCDAGTGNANVFPGIYTSLHVARFQADNIAKSLEGWTDAEVTNRLSLIATAYAHSGYAVLLLGESYCSIAIDRGPLLTRTQAFTEAETRFTKAIAAAQPTDAAIRNMALVGRARARLDIAIVDGAVANATKLAEAGTDAQAVPAGFVRLATYAATPGRRNNSIFNANNFTRSFTIGDAFKGVTHQGVVDPRVPVTNANALGTDGRTAVWVQGKYASLATSIPIARYNEAQLILAESQLESGNVAGATTIINAMHTAAGLPPFPGGTAAQVRTHLQSERANELFLEGHHLGDKLRYNLPFATAAGSPWPKGGVYGNTRCLPLPLQEKQDNPNLSVTP